MVDAGQWDLQYGYKELLTTLAGTGGTVFVGKEDGDILKVPLSKVPDCHGLVSGPPCPPWSSLGRQEHMT